MRIKGLPKSRRDDQTKPRIQSQDIVGNRILLHVKLIVLICHVCLMGRFSHGFGRNPVFMRLWIIVGCICNHIIFNILLCIQTMLHHKDRLLLATIWSKEIFIAVRRVRRARSQIQNIYSRGGVPRAYLTPNREACNVCASKSRWSNKWRLSKPNQ